MKQSIQVTILGQQYTLKTEAPPEQVQKVVSFVNQRIEDVVGAHRTVDTLNTAVLTLLNVAGSYLQLKEQTAGQEEGIERLLLRLEEALAETEVGTEEGVGREDNG